MVIGHVAFVVQDLGDRLLVLGGNQSDRVCIKAYPKKGYLTTRSIRPPPSASSTS